MSHVVGGGSVFTEDPCNGNGKLHEHDEGCTVPRCYCNDGFIRNANGKCVRPQELIPNEIYACNVVRGSDALCGGSRNTCVMSCIC